MSRLLVDPKNIPPYMAECITEDPEECGIFFDKETGDVGIMEDFLIYCENHKMKINWEKFKATYTMISKDF